AQTPSFTLPFCPTPLVNACISTPTTPMSTSTHTSTTQKTSLSPFVPAVTSSRPIIPRLQSRETSSTPNTASHGTFFRTRRLERLNSEPLSELSSRTSPLSQPQARVSCHQTITSTRRT